MHVIKQAQDVHLVNVQSLLLINRRNGSFANPPLRCLFFVLLSSNRDGYIGNFGGNQFDFILVIGVVILDQGVLPLLIAAVGLVRVDYSL
jgi:hypothetical protein